MNSGVVTKTTKSNLSVEAERSLSDLSESKMVVIQNPAATQQETEAAVSPRKETPPAVDTTTTDNITLSNNGLLLTPGNDLREDFDGEGEASSAADSREEHTIRKPADQDADSLAPTASTTEETTTEDLYGDDQQQQLEKTVGESQEEEDKQPQSLDLQTERRQRQAEEVKESTWNAIQPLKMIRKGAVAALGGTLVGVGLVMIPLPIPLGAVVASSGLAVLGTEFDSAREMNQTLMRKTQENVDTARDHMIRSIESIDSTGDADSDEEDATESSEEDENPEWLHMNPMERKRQEKRLKEKVWKENRTKWDETSEYITRSTGNFLTRNLLPFLKRTQGNTPSPTDEAANMKSAENESSPAEDIVADSSLKAQDAIEDSVLVVRSLDGMADTATDPPLTNQSVEEEVMVVESIENEATEPERPTAPVIA
jgi:hypothetical protein